MAENKVFKPTFDSELDLPEATTLAAVEEAAKPSGAKLHWWEAATMWGYLPFLVYVHTKTATTIELQFVNCDDGTLYTPVGGRTGKHTISIAPDNLELVYTRDPSTSLDTVGGAKRVVFLMLNHQVLHAKMKDMYDDAFHSNAWPEEYMNPKAAGKWPGGATGLMPMMKVTAFAMDLVVRLRDAGQTVTEDEIRAALHD